MEIENKSARNLNPKDSNLAVTEEDNQYFLEQSEKNGTIAKARIHYSAQSVNKIPDHYDASSKNILVTDRCSILRLLYVS